MQSLQYCDRDEWDWHNRSPWWYRNIDKTRITAMVFTVAKQIFTFKCLTLKCTQSGKTYLFLVFLTFYCSNYFTWQTLWINLKELPPFHHVTWNNYCRNNCPRLFAVHCRFFFIFKKDFLLNISDFLHNIYRVKASDIYDI